MSDPLSITASVAGIISLGVQVVGGITQYLDAVRERKDDVASAKAHVVRMQELLRLVDDVAAKVEPTHATTAAFLKTAASVQPELQALEGFMRSLDTAKFPSPSHEFIGKVYVQAKKLTYPFHRPTMDRLQSRLIQVNTMLQAALQILILDVAIDNERNTSAIKTTLPDLQRQLSEQLKQENVATRDAVARVGDSAVFLSGRFDQGLAKIHEDIAATSTTSVSVLRKGYAETEARVLQELAVTQSGVNELSDTFRRFDLALRALPTREELGRLISKPGQLKELCEIMEEPPESTTSQHSSHRSRINLARRTCVCRKRVLRSRRALLWGPWQALADTSTTHDHFPDCIFHFQGATVPSIRWSLAFKGLQGLINRAIEVSFSYSFGAGGCSLSPGFNYYPTIDRRRDPAFRIMGLLRWACLYMRGSEFCVGRFLEQCLENMALLYRHGKASPKAVDQYGRGVLHYFDIKLISEPRDLWLTGLDTLVKLGVQATMSDIYGSTPAWSTSCLALGPWAWDGPGEDRFEGPGAPPIWDMCSLVSEFLCAQEPCQTIVTESMLKLPMSEQTTMQLFCIMKRSPATAEAFGCGPLSLAALAGDFKKMDFLLTNYQNTINELNLLRQTPLHLAIGHTSCVALLLRGSGRKLIDLPDSTGWRPIDYALFSCICGTRAGENQYYDGCLKSYGDTSLNILLDADCMIPKIASWPLDRYFLRGSLCDNCLRSVSTHLVDRSEGLKRLAAHNLPRTQFTALGLSSHSLLDSNATRVIQALNNRGISVPPSLQVHGSCGERARNELTSVYHNSGPLPIPYSVLWSLGFRDLDTPDNCGLTPLMWWCKQFSYSIWQQAAGHCSWLIENGADLWNLAPDGLSTIGHELYAIIGQLSHWKALDRTGDEDSEQNLREHVFDLTGKLSQRDPRDRCRCACSPEGCTPFVRYLQAAFRPRYINAASELIEQLPKIIMETHTSATKAQMRSAIRYATFKMLGIRHTCCHDDSSLSFRRDRQHRQHRQSEELDELRQEDRSLVARLEDLATEFEEELEQMGQKQYVNKRVSFWHGYWLPRMQQVLESIESAEVEESDKVGAEEIGVVWHKPESWKGKGRDGDSDSDSDSGSEDFGYHECDWSSEIEEEDMIDTFRTTEDWSSRLDLIMAKAGMSAGR